MTAFTIGERVRTKNIQPSGHCRTPFYICGKEGIIERCCGEFPNPEELAYGMNGLPRKSLYRVRFLQKDIWPNYSGPDHDTLDLEIYEHWLERVKIHHDR